MEEQLLLDKLAMRYLTNQATAEELQVFVYLFKLGKLDETLNRLINAQIESDLKKE
jgi:hypothetical protein